MAKEKKWAVVNTNLDTGESVQYMETHQDWVVKHFVQKANESFQKTGRNFESKAVEVK